MSAGLVPDKLDHLSAVRSLAKLMDTAFTIPGTNVRFGLDALLGLLPGIGDAISSAVGGYIVMIAAQLGVSRAVLWRMTLNLGIDMLVGAIPLVGDLFDIGWKANVMNANLLERALADPEGTRRRSAGVLAGLVLVLLLLTAGTVALTWWVLQMLVKS
ncbi:MAG TPA: DUF4112 domain-containing protein [Gemmataceae bacterium]|nr:DUF4112 domain-containing protein [Gemmataceae bacterium]